MFYVFLWPHPGMAQALVAYEDAVLALVGEHNGEVVHRARTDGADGRPLEIQLFEWASQEAMDGYMADDSHGDTVAARTGLLTTTNTPLAFEAGDFVARIIFRDDRTLAGLYILNPDVAGGAGGLAAK
jgi:hypothetical protein